MPDVLDARVRFDSRAVDANGDPLGEWAEGFTVWARVQYLRGSESAVSNRIEGRQPVMIDVRENSQTRTITNAMRAVVVSGRGVRGGTELNINAVAPGQDPGFINILATAGGAVG
jgi:head-tail adaptor